MEKSINQNKGLEQIAEQSHRTLSKILQRTQASVVEIRIGQMTQKIRVPLNAMILLNEILKKMSQGEPVTHFPAQTELTTQEAADILGCSRPHLVKLLESGQIEFIKVGKHRRIKYTDLIRFKQKRHSDQKKYLIKMMSADQDSGLYDS